MTTEVAQTHVSEVAQREVVRARADEPLGHLVERMREGRRGNVLVEDGDGRLIGIFTERDLISRLDHGDGDWRSRPVSDYMTADPVTILASNTIAGALRRMGRGAFRHLPVVDASGHALGVLSIRDLLRHIAEAFPQEFINLPPDPEREAREPWGG